MGMAYGPSSIKAMVGGFFNRYFNRSADGRRQLGSIFKPIVYSAALQLKWNNLDSLNNKRDLFQFESTSYIPKPDHTPKSDEVSMAWAGVNSENLATIWLLYHLTDRLNLDEFRKVISLLDLIRKEDESYQEYVERIRDRYGIIINRETLFEAAFEKSKTEIKSDLIFNGMENQQDHNTNNITAHQVNREMDPQVEPGQRDEDNQKAGRQAKPAGFKLPEKISPDRDRPLGVSAGKTTA